jgi:acyl-coenzyme A synthetase/AMP-(fatty) acid ligase
MKTWPSLSIDPIKSKLWRENGFWVDCPITELFDEHVSLRPNQLCLIDSRREITYLELQELSYRLAAGLQKNGFQSGDVIAVQLPNWIEFVAIHLAVVRLCGVIALIPPISRGPEVAKMLRISKAKYWVITNHFKDFDYLSMAHQLNWDNLIVLGKSDSKSISFDDLIFSTINISDIKKQFNHIHKYADDFVEIVFTSGTTGDPKGVMHTHNTIMAPQLAMAQSLSVDHKSVLHMASTLSHQTGFLNGIHLTLQTGATTVLQDQWVVHRFLELAEKYKIQISSGSSTFLLDILRAPELDQFDLSSWRIFRAGGGPIPVALVEEAESRLPHLRVLRGWGQTENGVVTLSRLDDPQSIRCLTDGRVQRGMQIRVVDANNQTISSGQEGSLQCRGAFMCVAYANDPFMLSNDQQDDWFVTGDLATMDQNGNITLTGRQKDIIIRGGEKIPVHEIENILFKDERILEVAIVGMPDDRLGERACAFVLCRQGHQLSLNNMQDFLKDNNVVKQYWPERLEVVSSMPRSPNGKIKKAVLRQQIISSKILG